jgi:hypothetical protein
MMTANDEPKKDLMTNTKLPHSFASLGSCGLNFATMTEGNDGVQDKAGTNDMSTPNAGDLWQWMQGQMQRIVGLDQEKENTINDDNGAKQMEPQEQLLRRRIRDRVSEILSVYVDTSSQNPFEGQQPIAASE